MRDEELIAALQSGDANALEKVIDQYGGYVMAVVWRVLGTSAPQQDKEEIVSDVFVALWKNISTLKPESRLKAWFAVVARNHALNWVRSFRPAEELREDFYVSDKSEVEEPVERQEQEQLVRDVVDGLKGDDRSLFIRYYYWNQSITQIADETGMNPSTIKSRLFRGRQTLKAELSQRGYTL